MSNFQRWLPLRDADEEESLDAAVAVASVVDMDGPVSTPSILWVETVVPRAERAFHAPSKTLKPWIQAGRGGVPGSRPGVPTANSAVAPCLRQSMLFRVDSTVLLRQSLSSSSYDKRPLTIDRDGADLPCFPGRIAPWRLLLFAVLLSSCSSRSRTCGGGCSHNTHPPTKYP